MGRKKLNIPVTNADIRELKAGRVTITQLAARQNTNRITYRRRLFAFGIGKMERGPRSQPNRLTTEDVRKYTARSVDVLSLSKKYKVSITTVYRWMRSLHVNRIGKKRTE